MGYVLIIDNDQILRSVLTEQLSAVNVATKEAADGVEGLEIAKAEHPSVIILDEHMPRMDGQHFIEQLQKEDWYSNVHIVVFTTLHDTDLMNHKMLAGVTDYLNKGDSTPDSVVALVRKYMQPSAQPKPTS